jgi:hypothetical protein
MSSDNNRIVPAHELSARNGAVVDRTNFAPWPSATPSKGIHEGPTKLTFTSATSMPEVVLYEHIDFGGNQWRTNLSYSYVGDFWNDFISSIIVVSGTWTFYEHINFGGRSWTLTPNYYHWVEEVGIPNDIISSFKCIAL